MKLISIKIENYRSISEISINLEGLGDGTNTFGLIGVNEAGKSSILRAIALVNVDGNPVAKDHPDKTKPISISLEYKVDENSRSRMIANADIHDSEETDLITGLKNAETVVIVTSYESPNLNRKQDYFAIDQSGKRTDLDFSVIGPTLMSRAIFWTAEKRYLITDPINLDEFKANPDSVSIPLKNCFRLAGYEDIQSAINDLRESTDIEYLQKTLGEKVTKHILAVWPGHPIKITFFIYNSMLSFHVHDEGSKAKAKTVDQRSDGFKQFISFLLTISAESANESLTNAILLIDEPETHLHPKAQQHLLDEFKKITATENGNVVLFATHSTFLIDKKDLSRYYRVKKDGDQSAIERLGNAAISYSEVNYRVFDIYSTDFHSELYSKLHTKYQDEDSKEDKRSNIKVFDQGFFHQEKKLPLNKPWKAEQKSATLPTYIRNCIHHPDNGNQYSEEELIKSTDLMLTMLN